MKVRSEYPMTIGRLQDQETEHGTNPGTDMPGNGWANGTTVRPAETTVPYLENGDRLTRAEFERRYETMPHVKKAELVEGLVYMGSPVRVRAHGKPHGSVLMWIGTYSLATPGTLFADNATVRLDADNEFQPDVFLLLDEKTGGSSHLSNDDYIEGPPELVVEIAASSATIDRHLKMQVYRRAGVQEYLIYQVLARRVEWFALREGEYLPLAPDDRGVIHSEVFPGLRLDVGALLEGNLAAVLAEQQAGLASDEHRQFIETISARLAAQ
jgi:Uma2 family endonuclease